MSKVITLLGSTGSIGTQSLDVCRMHGYEVFGLSANSSVDKLLAQIAEFHPKYVAVTDPAAFDKLSAALAGQAGAPTLLKGADGLKQLAMMDGHELPVALGVIRDVDALVYDQEVARQTREVRDAKGYKSLRDLITRTQETWQIQ